MALVRLMYFSAATEEVALTDIKQILLSARNNNAGLGICGMLCYDNHYFLQALEGEREQVSELFLTISEDPRHDDVVLVSFEYIKAPLFPDWRMGYAGSNALLATLLNKMGQQRFEPEQLSPVQCLAILKSLSKQQDNIDSCA